MAGKLGPLAVLCLCCACASQPSAESERYLRIARPVNGHDSVCLVRTVTQGSDSYRTFTNLMNDLCMGYQDGRFTAEQYQNGLLAVTPLLAMHRAGEFVLAHPQADGGNQYRKLLASMRDNPPVMAVCRLFQQQTAADAITLTLCRDALDF